MKRLGHLVHLDGAQQARVRALLFQRVLQRQPVDHRRQHAHVVGRGAVDGQRFLPRAAKDISAAHHDGHLHAEVAHFLQFTGDARQRFGVDAGALRSLQGLSRKVSEPRA